MKKYILLLTITALALATQAQKTTQDVVYLKNGSILKGNLTSTQPVKLEMAGGSLWVFQPEEVDSLGKEKVTQAKLREIRSNYFRRNHGFMNMTEAGMIFSMDFTQPTQNNWGYQNNTPDIGISVHTVNGYRVWPYLYIGAGMGIDQYFKYNQTFSPFYLRVQSEFLKNKVTPYVFADAGYGHMWHRRSDGYYIYRNKGGIYFNAGAGVRIYTRSRASVIISAAYRRQPSQTNTYFINSWEGAPYYTTTRLYQQLAVNFGVAF